LSVLVATITGMKLRLLRIGDHLDEDTVLVRGGELNAGVLRADDGLGWSSLSDARDAAQVRPGVMLVAGNRFGKAVVRVMAVDEDGQVHFTVLPGMLEKNRHLVGRAPA
jgi:hypothetical protein